MHSNLTHALHLPRQIELVAQATKQFDIVIREPSWVKSAEPITPYDSQSKSYLLPIPGRSRLRLHISTGTAHVPLYKQN